MYAIPAWTPASRPVFRHKPSGFRNRRECHIDIWYVIWYLEWVKSIKKITINVPADLLNKALESSGEGITETIRRGLQLVAASKAYESLSKLRGKVHFNVDLKTLRKDRD